jgi:hypothetical protein
LEYYDQPPRIELDYLSKNGRRNRHPYTPDLFIIRKIPQDGKNARPHKS